MPPLRSSFASSRGSRDGKGRKLKLSQRGDPEKRPFLTRIYGMVGCLIVSLVLIAVLIILQKKLPDGAGSYFHIPVRRDLGNADLAPRRGAREEEKRAPTFVVDPIHPILSLGCYSTEVNCLTIDIPMRVKRMESTTCSTTVFTTPCTTSSSTPPPFRTAFPIHLTLPILPGPTPTPGLNCISGTSYEVDCVTNWIPHKMAKRQAETTCSTTDLGSCSTTPPTPPAIVTPTPAPTPGPTCISGTSYEVDCVTNWIPHKMAKRQAETTCSTTNLGPCSPTPTTPPPSLITPPPIWTSLIPINSCETLVEGCFYTLSNVDIGSTYTCISTTVSKPRCALSAPPSSITTPPVWSSIIPINACQTIAEGCFYTTESVGVEPIYTCLTTTVSRRDCVLTTSPVWSSFIPINSCVTVAEGCFYTTEDADLGGTAYTCITTTVSKPRCVLTTSTPVSVSTNSCMGSSLSCTELDSDTFCSTVYTSIPGCGVTTTTSSSSTTPTTPTITASSNSCVGTSLSCTELDSDTFCATVFSTIPGCGSTTTSSSPTTTPTSSSSPSPSPSSSSPTVSSTTPPVTSPSTTSSSTSPTIVIGPVSLSTNSSSSSISSSTGSSSSSPPTVVSVSVTTSSSSSSALSTPPPTRPSSSLPTSSSGSPTIVIGPVSVSSGSTSSSNSLSSPPGSPSVSVPTPIPGSSSSFSLPPVLVVTTPSGSTSLPSVSVSISSPPAGSISGSSPPPTPTTSGSTPPLPGTPVPASPSVSTASGSSIPLPIAGVLKTPSTLPTPTVSPVSPSTLATLPSGSTAPSVSVPTASGTSASGSLISSLVSASSNVLQSIDATGSLAPSGTVEGGGGGGGAGPAQTDDPKTIKAIPDIWPITQTMLGDYTPLVVSRGCVMLLRTMYEQLLTWEPIRQMLSPGGGSLVDSSVLTPIRIAIITAHIGTAFSAGLTFFDTGYCNPAQTNSVGICPPKLSINPWVSDVIIVTLVIQVLTILYVISQWWKKPGGFSADPTSIAGIAAFMGHPEIEQEFVQIPTEINYAGLKKRLKGKKFRLGQFATERGIVKYGIMPVEDEDGNPGKKEGFFDKLKAPFSNFGSRFTWLQNWKKNRYLFDVLFIMLLVALLGLTIDAVSRYNKTQVVFLATASAHGTGWRIFTAFLGVVVSYYWGQIFQDAQTFAPYIDLGRGSSDPDSTILLRRHSIAFTAFFPLIWHCHYTPAMIAFIGLAAELLIVSLSGLPYRPGQSRGEFLFWGITCLTILTIMLIQLIFLATWRRKLPHLPRAPESIAAVMTYLAGTSMTRDFNGLEQLKRSERDQAIRDLEKTYAYWWRREEDGRIRWVVDVVPGDKNNRALMDGASEFS